MGGRRFREKTLATLRRRRGGGGCWCRLRIHGWEGGRGGSGELIVSGRRWGGGGGCSGPGRGLAHPGVERVRTLVVGACPLAVGRGTGWAGLRALGGAPGRQQQEDTRRL